MRKPRLKDRIRFIGCILAPLRVENILFLVKRQKVTIAVSLLAFHLRFFHSVKLGDLTNTTVATRSLPNAKMPLIQLLGCLGYVDAFYALVKAREGSKCAAIATYQDSLSAPSPDAILLRTLNNKSVAIVGPSKGDDNEAEINSYDIVMRIGYSGPGSLPEHTGTRCDISFYARHKIDHLLDTRNFTALKKPQLLIVKKNIQKLKKQLNNEGLQDTEITASTPPLFRHSSANALVEALYNCLLCKTSRIKIFNADLFLSNFYPSGYIGNKGQSDTDSNWGYANLDMCKSFALSHFPHEQLELYKYYHKLERIQVDSRLASILAMTTDQYIQELDKLYGTPLRVDLGLAGSQR